MKKKLVDVWGIVERLSSKCAVTTGEQFEAFIEALRIVLDAPEVPGQEVEHGEWVHGEDVDIQCSVCGCDALTEGDYRQVQSAYCPHCGAKMDGGQKYAID